MILKFPPRTLSFLAAAVLFPGSPLPRVSPQTRIAAVAPTRAMMPSPTQKLLVGTWRLERCDNILPDGTRIELYGLHPKGLLIFDSAGRYSMQIMSASRPRFAANDKSKGTPEEYAAAVKGTNAHYGHYTVDEASHAVISHVEGATYSNWEGTDRKSPFTLEGDTLTYKVLAPTTGGNATGEVVWKRLMP